MEKALETLFTELNKIGVEVTNGVKGLTEYAYPILVKQHAMQGYLMLVALLFVVSVATILLITGKLIEKSDLDWDEEGAYILSIVAYVIAFIVAIIFITVGLPRIINPEYYAIQEIINTIRR